METLLNPNIGYLLLMTSVLLTLMAMLTPGTGFFELGALIAVGLAGVVVYNLSVNYWALVILAFGLIPFFLMIRRRDPSLTRIYLAISLALLFLGAAFLFQGENWLPGVHPLLILTTSLLEGGFLWIASLKALEAHEKPPLQNPDRLIGAEGEAKTDIHEEGSVQVASELWSARSQTPIPQGAMVRVVGREGFVLLVETIEN